MVFMWTDDIKGDDTYHKFVYLLLPHLQHITVHTDNNYIVLIYMRHRVSTIFIVLYYTNRNNVIIWIVSKSLIGLVKFRSRNQEHDDKNLTFSLCWHKAQFNTGVPNTANYWFCAFSLSSSVLPKIVQEHFTSLHRANHPFVLYIHRICTIQHTTHMRWYRIRVFATLAKRIYTLYTQQCALTRFETNESSVSKKRFYCVTLKWNVRI